MFLHLPFVFLHFHSLSLISHSCSLISHLCSLISHSCSLISHSCSLMSRFVFHSCSLVFHSCYLFPIHVHLCSIRVPICVVFYIDLICSLSYYSHSYNACLSNYCKNLMTPLSNNQAMKKGLQSRCLVYSFERCLNHIYKLKKKQFKICL